MLRFLFNLLADVIGCEPWDKQEYQVWCRAMRFRGYKRRKHVVVGPYSPSVEAIQQAAYSEATRAAYFRQTSLAHQLANSYGRATAAGLLAGEQEARQQARRLDAARQQEQSEEQQRTGISQLQHMEEVQQEREWSDGEKKSVAKLKEFLGRAAMQNDDYCGRDLQAYHNSCMSFNYGPSSHFHNVSYEGH